MKYPKGYKRYKCNSCGSYNTRSYKRCYLNWIVSLCDDCGLSTFQSWGKLINKDTKINKLTIDLDFNSYHLLYKTLSNIILDIDLFKVEYKLYYRNSSTKGFHVLIRLDKPISIKYLLPILKKYDDKKRYRIDTTQRLKKGWVFNILWDYKIKKGILYKSGKWIRMY